MVRCFFTDDKSFDSVGQRRGVALVARPHARDHDADSQGEREPRRRPDQLVTASEFAWNCLQ